MASAKAAVVQLRLSSHADRNDLLGAMFSVACPLAGMITVFGVAELAGATPQFVAPFGLPAWTGAFALMASLVLWGLARWCVAERGAQGRNAGWWLVALMVGAVAAPVVLPFSDMLLGTIYMTVVALVGLSAMARSAQVSNFAAMLVLPGLVWIASLALVVFSVVGGGWTPPFGATNGQNTAI